MAESKQHAVAALASSSRRSLSWGSSISQSFRQMETEDPFGRVQSEQEHRDDEENLRWAALEKLPTYDRARTAVLAMPEGELREVNVQKLGPQERHALLQRLAWVGDDHQRFLSKFKDRVDR